MFARILRMKFDAARRDEMMTLIESMRDELLTISGLHALHAIETTEGQMTVVSRYESEDAASAAQPAIQKALGRLRPFLTATPNIDTGDVIWEL